MDMKSKKISYCETDEECTEPGQACIPKGIKVGFVGDIRSKSIGVVSPNKIRKEREIVVVPKTYNENSSNRQDQKKSQYQADR